MRYRHGGGHAGKLVRRECLGGECGARYERCSEGVKIGLERATLLSLE